MSPKTRRLCQRNKRLRQRKLLLEALLKGEVGFIYGVRWLPWYSRKHPWDRRAIEIAA